MDSTIQSLNNRGQISKTSVKKLENALEFSSSLLVTDNGSKLSQMSESFLIQLL